MKEKERNELLSLYEEMKALRQAVYEEGNGLYAEWKSGISRMLLASVSLLIIIELYRFFK